MWDLIVSVPDHCLSFYFVTDILIGQSIEDWFSHFSLANIYIFGSKISSDNLSCDAVIFTGLGDFYR